MPSDIAVCPKCGSTNVAAVVEHPDYAPKYRFYCRHCGHVTPEREHVRDAAGDVIWQPAAASVKRP